MKKKIVLIGMVFFISQLCFAETCPSIKDIKTRLTNGWRAYDSYEGTPLSLERENQFKTTVKEFVLAEWVESKQDGGRIHCYYRDKDGSDLETYIAKDNFIAKNSKKFWYKVSGAMHCAAGMEKCEFQSRPLTKHLAKR